MRKNDDSVPSAAIISEQNLRILLPAGVRIRAESFASWSNQRTCRLAPGAQAPLTIRGSKYQQTTQSSARFLIYQLSTGLFEQAECLSVYCDLTTVFVSS